MSSIFERLYKIGRTYAASLQERFQDRPAFVDPTEDIPEEDIPETEDFKTGTSSRHPSMPPQLVEDLANFGLTPPSSLAAVKRARNREIKKFHPDFFGNNTEKAETAKQILQILNASYDRLETYYNGGVK